MDFDRIQFEKDISHYSGGQKKNCLSLKVYVKKPIYIGRTTKFYRYLFRMQIEELIQQFNPTMVIVEHDKAFQQTVATKTISM